MHRALCTWAGEALLAVHGSWRLTSLIQCCPMADVVGKGHVETDGSMGSLD